MLLVDDILLVPFKGVFWIFKEIHRRARDEVKAQKEQLQSQLSDLYMEVDTGRLSDEVFEAKQKEILDQLERIKKLEAEGEGAPPGQEQR